MDVDNSGPDADQTALADWMMSLIKTMRADMDSEKLYPPGEVYHLVSPDSSSYICSLANDILGIL